MAASAASVVLSSAAYETFNLSFQWESFSLTLEAGAEQDKGLARFRVQKFDVKLVTRADQSMDLLMTVDSLSLLDQRSEVSEAHGVHVLPANRPQNALFCLWS